MHILIPSTEKPLEMMMDSINTPGSQIVVANSIQAFQNLYTNVHSNFMHNSQKLEIAQMSFSRQSYSTVLLHDRILLSNQKEQLLTHTTTWMNCQVIILKGEKASPPKLHAVWFQLYNILEGTEVQKWKTNLVVAKYQGLSGSGDGRDVGVVIKRQRQRSFGVGTVCFLYCHGYKTLHRL